MRLSFTIPGVPVPKGRPRFAGKHAYTPPRSRDWERHVWACAARELGARSWPRASRVRARLVFYGASPTSDTDNLAKAILDGLQGVLYENDRHVVELHCERHEADERGPRAVVTIEVIA